MNKNQDWVAVIADWESSGLSQSEYCKRSGIRDNQFSYWKRKLLPSKSASTSDFIPLTTQEVIKLEVGSAKLELPSSFQASKLAELLRCLS